MLPHQVWSGHLGKPLACIEDTELGPCVSIAISLSRTMVAIGYHSGWISNHDINGR